MHNIEIRIRIYPSLDMKVLIIDGYVDEPSYLGVPPFISPYPRAAAGAAKTAGADVRYITIGQIRKGAALPPADVAAVIAGSSVPGKYLRGRPASKREIAEISGKIDGVRILGGPMGAYFADEALDDLFELTVTRDIEAAVWEYASSGKIVDRRRSLEEFDEWSLAGADICREHPDYAGPLIAEIQTYRGCVRSFSGGCKFCVEPSFGEVEFRNPDSVIMEAEALAKAGVRNLRVGGQSCFISYMAEGLGQSETPKPSPGMIDHLLRGIREVADPEVLHLDNANPAVISKYPDESRRIMQSIVRYCTPGNVLALGLESADPAVMEANNLNSTPDQALTAIEIMNEAGRERGPNGMPMLLPGINFLAGLEGESRRSFEYNIDFLKDIIRRDLLLRRINVRQVIRSREGYSGAKTDRRSFTKFKRWVRENADRPLLERMLPIGTVLRNVYLEVHDGNNTFGRQVGSYPLLVGLPYKIEIDRFIDVAVTAYGYRSITGVQYPLDPNTASMSALSSIPGIGEKRAMRIVRNRPINSLTELRNALDDARIADDIMRYMTFKGEGGAA